jgi:ABC-type nitrate/sulfonate/bicarbonate transport system substrate-binding protein
MKRTFIMILLILATVLSGFASLSCAPRSYSGPIQPITLAYSPYLETAVYWIAENQHFFSQNGLEVTFVKYDTLAPAVDALLKGEVDIVGNITEFQLATRALQNARISTIGSVTNSQTTFLIGRKDRGINQISDLKGKRVGSLLGTLTDFYIARLLQLNGMSVKDVTIIGVNSAAISVSAVVNGDVDAIVVGQPYANSARNQLGSNAFYQSAQSGQSLYALAVSTNDWLTKNPEIVTRFLKSLAQSEEFLVRRPAEAKTIIQNRLNIDTASLESILPQDTFSLSLDQSLIIAMEDEARWIISNNLTSAKTVPNFLDYLYTDGLKAVDPSAVSIVGK